MQKRYILQSALDNYVQDTDFERIDKGRIVPVYTDNIQDAWKMSKSDVKTFLKAIKNTDRNTVFKVIELVAYEFDD